VLFTGLAKYDGTRRGTSRHGVPPDRRSAGRAGYDTAGNVVVQAPEHDIENERKLAKAGDDPKKRRNVVRKKPPEGFVSWGQPTYERLVNAEPETLTSHFQVSHSMLLNVVSRPDGDPVAAMRHLLTDNHEPPAAQRRHIQRALAGYRALRSAGVVERLPEPDEQGRTIRLTVDLQADFALNQPLSPFALAAFELLDLESPTYALDLVSVDRGDARRPAAGARRAAQPRQGRGRAQMKAEGIEYEQRMELLEDITHPQPNVELLTAAWEIYRGGHPWVADHPLGPSRSCATCTSGP
jgi:hypothetical protein